MRKKISSLQFYLRKDVRRHKGEIFTNEGGRAVYTNLICFYSGCAFNFTFFARYHGFEDMRIHCIGQFKEKLKQLEEGMAP